MGGLRKLVGAFGIIAVLSFAATPACAAEPTAADRETTRGLLAEGDRLVAAQDYAGALRAFEGAAAIIAVPTTVIEVARMEEALGKLVEARDTYLRAARIPVIAGEPAPFAPARQEATELATKLVARIPSIVVAVTGAKSDVVPVVIVDGEEIPAAAALLPRKVNPGPHTAVVKAVGYKEARRDADVREGEIRTVEVMLEIDPAAVPPPTTLSPSPPSSVHEDRSPTLMYAGFGTGAAGLAVGTIFGLMSLSRASDARNHCNNNHCTSKAQPDIDASTTLANVANVGMAVALIGAGIGVYALVTQPKAKAAAWTITPLGARGTF